MERALIDRVETLENVILTLSDRVDVVEQIRSGGGKYSHIYHKLDKMEVSETITIKTESAVESSRICCAIPNYSKKVGKAFRTMTHENCIVILRTS